MRVETVTREIPTGKLSGLMRKAWPLLNKFNDRKIGKHRRGTVQLQGVSWVKLFRDGDDYVEVTLKLAYGAPRVLRVVGGGKFDTHKCRDFRPLMKALANG